MSHRYLSLLVVFVLTAGLTTQVSSAQGGPPMITEGTGMLPGSGWELNVAGTVEPQGRARLFSAPELDLNYGLSDRLLVSVTWPWRVRDRPTNDVQQAPGRVVAGLKALVVEDWKGLSASTYPLLSRGLHNSGDVGWLPHPWGLRLPLQVSGTVGPVAVAGEGAYTVVNAAPNELSYGVVARVPVSARVEIAGEVGGAGPTDLGDDQAVFVNGGVTAQIVPGLNANASVGHLLTGQADDGTSLFGFLGVQFLW